MASTSTRSTSTVIRADGERGRGAGRAHELGAPKTRTDDLALFGGLPAFRSKVHVGQPNIGQRARLHARIDDMLDRRWLSNDGPYLKEFEAALKSRLRVRHCVAVVNATTGLEIAIRAAGLRGEVIVPSFTFIATAHALLW